jgi:hypothetical protein
MNLATLKYQYEGPVFTNKVSDEQKASARAMEAFTNELRGMFRQQFGRFTGILNYLEGQLKPVMQEGFFEGEETALRTSATENITPVLAPSSALLSARSVSSLPISAAVSAVFPTRSVTNRSSTTLHPRRAYLTCFLSKR